MASDSFPERDLEMRVEGHSRSLIGIPFNKLRVDFC